MFSREQEIIKFFEQKDIDKFLDDLKNNLDEEFDSSLLDKISIFSFQNFKDIRCYYPLDDAEKYCPIKCATEDIYSYCYAAYINLLRRIVSIRPEVLEYVEEKINDGIRLEDYETVATGLSFVSNFDRREENYIQYLKSEVSPKDEKRSLRLDAEPKKVVKVEKYREIIKSILKNNPLQLKYTSDDIKDDEELVMLVVQEDGNLLEYVSPRLRNKKKVVIAAIKNDVHAYKLVSEELKKDKEVVMAVIKKDVYILLEYGFKKNCELGYKWSEFISSELMDDKDIVMLALNENPGLLEYVSERLKNDKEVVMAAVQKNGAALEFASKRLKNDKEVVMAAVQKNGAVLEFASKRLKNDKEVVMTAISYDRRAFKHASPRLRNKKKIVLAALQPGHRGIYLEEEPYSKTFRYVSRRLKKDKEVIMEAVKQDVRTLEQVSKRIRNNKKFIMKCVQQNGLALRYVSEKLKKDKEVVLAALKQNVRALRCTLVRTKMDSNHISFYIPKEIIEDKEIVRSIREIFKIDSKWICFAKTYLAMDEQEALRIWNLYVDDKKDIQDGEPVVPQKDEKEEYMTYEEYNNRTFGIKNRNNSKNTINTLKVISASLAGINILTVLLSRLSGKVESNNIIINFINSDFMKNVSMNPKIYGSLIVSALGFSTVCGMIISDSKKLKK